MSARDNYRLRKQWSRCDGEPRCDTSVGSMMNARWHKSQAKQIGVRLQQRGVDTKRLVDRVELLETHAFSTMMAVRVASDDE